MKRLSRRQFVGGAAVAAGCWAAGRLTGGVAWAEPEAAPGGMVTIDSVRRVGPLDRNIFGSFVEHLGRCVYGGIYEPGSKLADADGYRTDVRDEVRRLGVPIIRYPGGNFVSGYNWLDGVGPRQNRPRVLDRAWNTIETNQFGTNEFMTWCRAVGAEPLFGTNFGTGTPETTAALMEYCNVEKGTKWSDLRRQHGYEKPHNIKYWCLGNEMDGPWQIGHIPATQYGIKARDAARQMRTIDRSCQLIACGSSGPYMPTYLEWDQQVLEECYDEVDAISLHHYFGNGEEATENSQTYVALNLAMERQISEIIDVCDVVRGRKRSNKALWLSFDEWNVRYRARSGELVNDGQRQVAPHMKEKFFSLEDALLVGGLLNTLIRRSDRVRVACLAQLVNMKAPIMTNETGVLRQIIYYPYQWALQYARGSALGLATESPTYDPASLEGTNAASEATRRLGSVPYLDVAGTLDDGAKSATLFILNRDLEKARELKVDWHDLTPSRVISCQVLTGSDLNATNTFDAPERVKPQALDPPTLGARMTIQVPARSYSVINLSVG